MSIARPASMSRARAPPRARILTYVNPDTDAHDVQAASNCREGNEPGSAMSGIDGPGERHWVDAAASAPRVPRGGLVAPCGASIPLRTRRDD